MKGLLIFFFLLAGTEALNAQKYLEGLWEGVLTTGGIASQSGYKMELFLEIKGKKVKGRSYIHLGESQIVEMHLEGILFDDRSMYLEETLYISAPESTYQPPYLRKYQLVSSRSFWDAKMEGYWQQIMDKPLDEKRQRGRVMLKKVEQSKA